MLKIRRCTRIYLATVAGAVGLLFHSAIFAANPEPVVAEVEFVDPITITEVTALRYGFLDANLANAETVVIATNSAVTDAGGNILGGTQAAANVAVTATAAQAITILVDTVVDGTGYALGTFLCAYDGGTITACDGAGYSETSVASATLLIGATLTGDGLAAVGVANGSFNVTVSYQ